MDAKNSPKVERVIAEACKVNEQFDPSGSYTGKPVNENEKPVQDADDL